MKDKYYEKLNGWPATALGLVILVALFGYGAYTYNNLEIEKSKILSELETEREENYELLHAVRDRQEVIDSFQGQISNIAGTVGVLDKLAKTDEELLKKYSKIFFLNENYTPSKLSDISKEYLIGTASNYMIHTDVLPYLERLIKAAKDDGHNLLVASAFRSFQTQSALKNAYTVSYGSGANRFSADQGYSEHQLGTTVDFTNKELGANFNAFGSTKAYQWLLENAHNYGFILSYPPNNQYYKYEPWHWRYVGTKLATKLHEDKQYFYDLDQREIDEYLVNLFP